MEEALVAFSRAPAKMPKSRGFKLFSEGHHLESLFIIEEGYAKIFKEDANGREALYSIAGPRSACGISLENGNSHSRYSAQMITEGVVREIPHSNFAKFCNEEPRAWRWLAEREARQRASLERRIEILSLPDVAKRVAAIIPYLIEECRFPQEPDGSFVLPLLQSDLAGFVCATRETTSAMLNILAKRKLLIPLRGRVVILDLPALRQT